MSTCDTQNGAPLFAITLLFVNCEICGIKPNDTLWPAHLLLGWAASQRVYWCPRVRAPPGRCVMIPLSDAAARAFASGRRDPSLSLASGYHTHSPPPGASSISFSWHPSNELTVRPWTRAKSCTSWLTAHQLIVAEEYAARPDERPVEGELEEGLAPRAPSPGI